MSTNENLKASMHINDVVGQHMGSRLRFSILDDIMYRALSWQCRGTCSPCSD